MKLIYPSVELWEQDDKVHHIARCARVCYASDSDSKGSDENLVKSLMTRNHTSMFRHESVYFIIEKAYSGKEKYRKIYDELTKYTYCPYIKFVIEHGIIYISTNGDFYNNSKYDRLIDLIYDSEVTIEQFRKSITGQFLTRYTFCVVTQISTSRELNRTSPNNIAEQSTRYVNFGKKGGITICLPHWWDDANWFKKFIHKAYWKSCEIMYNFLLKIGFKPQDARGVLPLDTATKCVYTYNVKEWKHIIDLRYHGITGKPHPNAYVIAKDIANELARLGYEIL